MLSLCDSEMIGDVHSLEVARNAGLLNKLFKPVVAMGIEKALGGVASPDVSSAVSAVGSGLLGNSLTVSFLPS